MSTRRPAWDGDSQNGGHVQMRSKNRFSKQCLHDGLQGKVIFKNGGHIVQMRNKNRFSNRCLHSTWWSGGEGDLQSVGHIVQLRSKNGFSNWCLHDGLQGMVILEMTVMYKWEVRIDSQIHVYMMVWRDGDSKNCGHVQMRSKNRFSNWCLQDGLEGMVILKMAAMYRWEVRIDSQSDVYMIFWRGWWFSKWRPGTNDK